MPEYSADGAYGVPEEILKYGTPVPGPAVDIVALSTAANYYGRGIEWRAFDSAVFIAESNTRGDGSCIVNIDGTFLDAVTDEHKLAYAEIDLSAETRLPDRPQFDDFRSRIANERRVEAYGPLCDPIPPGDKAPR